MTRLLLALLCAMPMFSLLIQHLAGLLGSAAPWRLPLWLAASCPLLLLPLLLQRDERDEPAAAPTTVDDGSVDDKVVVLAAGLAHELGQPLSVARVGVEGLHMLRQMGREPSPEYVDKTLRAIGRSVLAMTSIIEHLRDLALRTREADLQQVDLVAFTNDLLAERDLWLRFADLEIHWEQDNQEPNLAEVDAKGLRLILVNLIKNAAEAVTRLPDEQRRVTLRNLGRACVVVHNRGAAIAPDRQAQIFDPFVSSKRASSDGPRLQGIGLYLSHVTAERMGAHLAVQSTEEDGTAFTLACRLPEGR